MIKGNFMFGAAKVIRVLVGGGARSADTNVRATSPSLGIPA